MNKHKMMKSAKRVFHVNKQITVKKFYVDETENYINK